MTVQRAVPADERACIAELLHLLARVRCVDSHVYIEVGDRTFESFAGQTQVILDEHGCPDFLSKHVLDIQHEPSSPGSGVEVVLWTKPQRRLQLA